MQKMIFLTLLLSTAAFAQPGDSVPAPSSPATSMPAPSMPANGQMTIENTTKNGQTQTTVIDSGGNLKSVDSTSPPAQPMSQSSQTPASAPTPGVGAELPQATSPNQPAVPVQTMPPQGVQQPAPDSINVAPRGQ